MKRIGITQRLEHIHDRDENRDALDTHWAELLWSLGYMPIMLSSHITDIHLYLKELALDAFILSGGNDIGSAIPRDNLEEAVLNFAEKEKLPVLGVCRGMQFINHYLGGKLSKVDGHVAIKHSLSGRWAHERGFNDVNSYHDKAILPMHLSSKLEILASSTDGIIEAVKHQNLPWLGIMWHPEREIPFKQNDIKLLKELFGE
ncbi:MULTISPECIES: gamma-glutamyl-gamma-aminobutyrate hydrolase family protein [Providencia]|uniref:gamma-glutamyl-gamma-aminobutyrate hydrolase family protein n=1 Tax=Providencia rettgeri TaxID=587 RepID=UPI000197C6A0|nr:gamma-glutamyl-gamma-aminobutyrate hydrolase family protein [Providencia rettgeri]EFE51486.1 class I glutamine amidotransferase [Providencia rettgeri DSM 1131]QXA57965.1 gamma-glutamyl-gamma-aminobutyrate hydrolase family protein [Providencia rettgeri]